MEKRIGPIPPLVSRISWVDAWLFGYLAAAAAFYATGARLADVIFRRFGAMPVRGGLWSWVWSVDRAGNAEAARMAGWMAAGGLAAVVLERTAGLGRLRSYRGWIWLVFSIGAGVFFWYERVLGSLGDSLAYLGMASEHVWFKLSQPLSTALFAASYAVLGKLGWPVAPSLALVGCLAGSVWIIALALLAEELPPWPARLLLACGLFAGGVGLFFGYLETTSAAIAVSAVYAYFGCRAIREQGHWLVLAGLALGIALALHGQMLYLLPSFLVVSWAAYQKGARKALALGGALVILPALLIVGFALTHPALTTAGFGDALGGGDNRMFIPVFKVETPTEYYTLLSFNYLTELLNLGMRTAPLAGLLLIPAAIGFWTRRREPAAWFWASAAVCAGSFVLLWNPDLGMAHDWDLFTPPLMLIVIAGAFLWPAGWQPRWGTLWAGAALGFSAAALSVVVSYFSPAGTWDLWATTVRPEQPLAVRFDGQIDLLGYDSLQPAYAAGETLTVQLLWRPRQPLPLDYTAGVYLIQSSGGGERVIGQDDHRPKAFIERFSSEWVVGEIIQDLHSITVPAGSPAGEYQLWVTLYDLNTMGRLPVGPADGPDHLVLARISVR